MKCLTDSIDKGEPEEVPPYYASRLICQKIHITICYVEKKLHKYLYMSKKNCTFAAQKFYVS